MTADSPAPATTSDGHFDLDTLAHLDAGVYDEVTETAIRNHVSQCRRCELVVTRLTQVRTQLRALPQIQMPDLVAARLEAALRAERTHVPDVPFAQRTQREALPIRDLSAARQRRARRRQALSWAAAGIVGVAGATAVFLATQSGEDGDVPGLARPTQSESTSPGTPEYSRTSLLQDLDEINNKGSLDQTGGPSDQVAGRMSSVADRIQCLGAMSSLGLPPNPRAVQEVIFEGERAFVFTYQNGQVAVVGDRCGQGPTRVLFSN